jgi:hypothetical protein
MESNSKPTEVNTPMNEPAKISGQEVFRFRTSGGAGQAERVRQMVEHFNQEVIGEIDTPYSWV